MNYCEIKPADVANGDGVRVSLFVSGCRNHCKGCFNPETWDFNAGCLFDQDAENRILELLNRPYINGLTLLGGDPFEPENQHALVALLRRVRETIPNKTVWVYSGYVYERDMVPGGKVYGDSTDEFLAAITVLVDGPFVEEQKDITLKFRGSSNQRLIDLPATRRSGAIVLLT